MLSMHSSQQKRSACTLAHLHACHPSLWWRAALALDALARKLVRAAVVGAAVAGTPGHGHFIQRLGAAAAFDWKAVLAGLIAGAKLAGTGDRFPTKLEGDPVRLHPRSAGLVAGGKVPPVAFDSFE